jgi:hypothetical protein
VKNNPILALTDKSLVTRTGLGRKGKEEGNGGKGGKGRKRRDRRKGRGRKEEK